MDFDWRPGAYAVITDDDHVLLSLWEGPTRSWWTLPGGGIEFSEDPGQTCIREVFEETGYHVRLDQLISASSATIAAKDRIHGQPNPLMILRILYTATVVSGVLTPETDGSSVDAAWLPLATLTDRSTTGGHGVPPWVLKHLTEAGISYGTDQDTD